MSDRPELLDIGVIGRAHGLKGEVSVALSTNVADRLFVGATFETERGRLSIVRLRPHQGRQLVTFDGVNDRTGAERLKGLRLLAERHDDAPDEGYWVHELIGLMVRDANHVDRGPVVAVEANPASDLLVLESGALVPVRFVAEVAEGVVHVDAPDGLFDL